MDPASLQHDCCVLLDDCHASPEAPTSRLYTGHVQTLVSADATGLGTLLQRAQEALERGLHAVLLCDYELGEGLHRIAPRQPAGSGAQVLLFSSCCMLSADQVDSWLLQMAGNAPAGIAGLRAGEDVERFSSAIARIHAWLEAGDAYQVNYTWRYHLDCCRTAVRCCRCRPSCSCDRTAARWRRSR